MLRLLHDTHFNFIKYWRHMAVITIAWILIGIGSFAVTGPINYSIEFTGGTLLQLEFRQPPNIATIRSSLDAAGIRGAEIQQFGSPREFTVRAQDREHVAQQAAGAETVGRQIEETLTRVFGANSFTVVRTGAVGPRVGSELRRGALIAVLISFLITLIYLAIRFEWRFGVATVLATAHDLLTTIAFLKLMHLEVSLTVVAAILTVIGYSMNDTIIIFDRVRENLKKQRKESMYDVLNRSINETLPRSVLTHATTLAATLSLLFFAGEVIRPFAWVMSFGIFTGTFSSVYVAAPILLWIERKWPRETAIKGTAPRTVRETASRPKPAVPAGSR